ncbi:MAG: carboxymuconolactone decarboxylase family protein [Candidatus Promineifilaceae bacterium]|nr:carboxymuconolactone decarboxylase family protein [Candidatus Promineifilaceae bacterium]
MAIADVQTTTDTRSAVEQEIRETLGLVPSFFKEIPDEVVAQEWELFKHWELEETLIPNKYKELLMLAVHAETRCRYCTLFHTEVARLFGATDEEVQEAVHLAKHTVAWSVYLNGMQEDYDRFASELAEIGAYLS